MTERTFSDALARSPENDAIYRYARSEMQFEFSLINARVNWLITSQAFLFVPLVVGTRGNSVAESVFFPFIPHLGIVLCLLVLVSVFAAVWRAQQWRRKFSQGAYCGVAEHHRFSIVMPRSPLIPLMGLVGMLGVPIALAAAWGWVRMWPPGL